MLKSRSRAEAVLLAHLRSFVEARIRVQVAFLIILRRLHKSRFLYKIKMSLNESSTPCRLSGMERIRITWQSRT